MVKLTVPDAFESRATSCPFVYIILSTEGLVAYWKFNEGTGKQVKDYTANGNNITAENDLTWTKVSLPEK